MGRYRACSRLVGRPKVVRAVPLLATQPSSPSPVGVCSRFHLELSVEWYINWLQNQSGEASTSSDYRFSASRSARYEQFQLRGTHGSQMCIAPCIPLCCGAIRHFLSMRLAVTTPALRDPSTMYEYCISVDLSQFANEKAQKLSMGIKSFF